MTEMHTDFIGFYETRERAQMYESFYRDRGFDATAVRRHGIWRIRLVRPVAFLPDDVWDTPERARWTQT